MTIKNKIALRVISVQYKAIKVALYIINTQNS